MKPPERHEKQSEILFEQFERAARHPNTIKAIENLKKACDYLESEGVRVEITVAEVGLLTKDWRGGPTTPSIRNNKNFLEYIKVRRAEQTLPKLPQRDGSKKVSTGNPAVDSYIHSLEAEIRRLRSKISSLHSSIGAAGEYDLDASIKSKKLVLAPAMEAKTARTSMRDSEVVSTLAKLANRDHVERFGLMESAGSLVSPENGNIVFLDKVEYSAIRRVVDNYLQVQEGVSSAIRSPQVQSATAKVLDPAHLRRFGLTFDDGRISSPERNDAVFLDRRDVERLKKLLELLSPN
jgi:hypothetical protein